MTLHRTAIGGMLLLLSLIVGAHAACTVRERGTVLFAPVGRVLLVPLTINGVNANFIVDTGADHSLVTSEAVHRLGLASDQWVATTMRGVGGIVEHPNVDPRSLALGAVPLHPRTVTHDISLRVADMSWPLAPGLVVDGLLGRDLLSPFDVQIDVPDHRLTLFDVSGCSGQFVPWTGDVAVLPAAMPLAQMMIVPMQIDGHPLRALLDTGSESSLILAPGMFRLGLTPEMLARDPSAAIRGGIGPHALPVHRHAFSSWQVGSWAVQNPSIWVANARLMPIWDALLGADWLFAQRRVWISFATGQVFFQH